MANFNADEIGYLVNHLFLPPQLPGADDHSVKYDSTLLALVCQTLKSFTDDFRLPAQQSKCSLIATAAFLNLARLQNEEGHLDASNLAEVLRSLASADIGECSLFLPQK